MEDLDCFRPGIGIWVCRVDIAGSAAVSKGPDLDCIACPFHSNNTPTSTVETGAVAASTRVFYDTSGGPCASSGVVVAIVVQHLTSACVVRIDLAARTSIMKDGDSVIPVVDTFNDIDLTIVRPILSQGPVSGPETTSRSWHMADISNPEALCPSCRALNAHR